jgi:hypothetical protein
MIAYSMAEPPVMIQAAIAATVNASNVRGFYGRETLTGGSYSASYYISTTRF